MLSSLLSSADNSWVRTRSRMCTFIRGLLKFKRNAKKINAVIVTESPSLALIMKSHARKVAYSILSLSLSLYNSLSATLSILVQPNSSTLSHRLSLKQCDQIGRFFELLWNKFSYKKSPNNLLIFWLF